MKRLISTLSALLFASSVWAQTYPSPTFNNVTAIGTLSLPNNPLGLASGGLGAATAAGGRATLGLGTASTQNTGTSGATVPLLNGVNTWAANQTISTNSPQLFLQAVSGGNRIVWGTTAGSTRWGLILGNSTTESGSNAGADFALNRYSDAGTFIDSPLAITRSTGVVTLSQPLPISSGGTGGTTQATARSGIGAAASGANSDITSLSGLTTPLSVAQGGSGATTSTGSGSNVLSTSPTLVTPTIGAASATSINKVAITAPATSATLTIANGTTLTTTSSTSVGQGQYLGTATNDSAVAGNIGEFVSSTVLGTSLTSATITNPTSISLTPGDWDIQSVCGYNPSGGALYTSIQCGVTPTSGASPGFGGRTINNYSEVSSLTIVQDSPTVRLSLGTTTTVYLFAYGVFSPGTSTVDALIRARRVR